MFKILTLFKEKQSYFVQATPAWLIIMTNTLTTCMKSMAAVSLSCPYLTRGMSSLLLTTRPKLQVKEIHHVYVFAYKCLFASSFTKKHAYTGWDDELFIYRLIV